MPDIYKATSDLNRANTDRGAVSRRLAFTDPESDAALSTQIIDNRAVLENRQTAAYEELKQGVKQWQRQNLQAFANEGGPVDRTIAAVGSGSMSAGEWLPDLWGPKSFVDTAETHRGGQLTGDQQ